MIWNHCSTSFRFDIRSLCLGEISEYAGQQERVMIIWLTFLEFILYTDNLDFTEERRESHEKTFQIYKHLSWPQITLLLLLNAWGKLAIAKNRVCIVYVKKEEERGFTKLVHKITVKHFLFDIKSISSHDNINSKNNGEELLKYMI